MKQTLQTFYATITGRKGNWVPDYQVTRLQLKKLPREARETSLRLRQGVIRVLHGVQTDLSLGGSLRNELSPWHWLNHCNITLKRKVQCEATWPEVTDKFDLLQFSNNSFQKWPADNRKYFPYCPKVFMQTDLFNASSFPVAASGSG